MSTDVIAGATSGLRDMVFPESVLEPCCSRPDATESVSFLRLNGLFIEWAESPLMQAARLPLLYGRRAAADQPPQQEAMEEAAVGGCEDEHRPASLQPALASLGSGGFLEHARCVRFKSLEMSTFSIYWWFRTDCVHRAAESVLSPTLTRLLTPAAPPHTFLGPV